MKDLTSTISLFLVAVVAISTGFLISCGQPQYVRDTEHEEIDEYTMSLRFDRRDLDRLYEDNISVLLNSTIAREWDRGDNPNVAILPFRNETSEHIDSQLETLLTKFETDLVNRTSAEVVSVVDQPEMIRRVRNQQSEEYNPSEVATYAEQLGAEYFVTGRVYDVSERVGDQRRVQYFLFVQVIETETSQIHYQNESSLTKGLVR